MKRYFLALFLLYGVAYAQDIPPDFNEFYAPMKQSGWQAFRTGGLFNSLTKGSQDKRDDSYWAQRRAAFDRQVQGCATLPEPVSRSNCYMQVRQVETMKTESYVNRTQQSWEASRLRRNLNRPTTTNTNCYAVGNQMHCNSF